MLMVALIELDEMNHLITSGFPEAELIHSSPTEKKVHTVCPMT